MSVSAHFNGKRMRSIEPLEVPVPPLRHVEELVRRTDSEQRSTGPAFAVATRTKHKGLIQGFLESAERFPSRDALVVDNTNLSYCEPRKRAAATHARGIPSSLPSIQSEVPVVVVAGTLNALGVVRSLAFGRMPIYVVSTSRYCAAGWSRFCNFVRIPSLDGRSLIDSLMELGMRLGHRPVLILTADQCVNAVSAHGDEIERLYRISLPSGEVVRALSDKILFQDLAEREGFAVPRGVALESEADLALMERLIPPLIIKPADKTLVLNGVAERAVRANTLAEARTSVKRMLMEAPRLIVQEWIHGSDSQIFFSLFSCDRDSSLIGMFSGRKLVCSPPEIGTTALCVAAPEATAELRALVLNFIARVGYRGLGSLEVKRDSATGRFIIIEPTVGRTDWQEEIATLCGINLPLITYWAELGCPTAMNSGAIGSVAWRSSVEHRVPPGALLPGTRVIDGFFRWSDPLPAFHHYAVERFAARLLRRAERFFPSRH
jgi:D-aspartate ligase